MCPKINENGSVGGEVSSGQVVSSAHGGSEEAASPYMYVLYIY
jgi:hypothetical protein